MGQQQIQIDGKVDEQDLSTQEKIVRAREDTNDDGTVNVQIDSWQELPDGEIEVVFLLPTGERRSERMEFPEPGGDAADYKFLRLLDRCGLSVWTADSLTGEMVRAERRENGWELVAPERSGAAEQALTTIERVARGIGRINWLRALTTVLWLFLVGLIAFEVVTAL